MVADARLRVIASMLSFRQVLGLPVFFLLILGLAPLLMWYMLTSKRRGKLRTLKITGQGTGLCIFVPVLLVFATGSLEIKTFWPILACWVVTFAIGRASLERLATLERRARLKDARERTH